MEKNKNIVADEFVEKVKFGNDSEEKSRLYGGAAVIGISGLSAIIAGLVTSHIAKKRNSELLRELGKERIVPPVMLESPISLAFRALAWGTVWAVGGCSLIMFGIWKWYGFKDIEDFRTRLRSHIKKTPTDEKTEFENLSEFLSYLNEVHSEEKKKKGT